MPAEGSTYGRVDADPAIAAADNAVVAADGAAFAETSAAVAAAAAVVAAADGADADAVVAAAADGAAAVVAADDDAAAAADDAAGFLCQTGIADSGGESASVPRRCWGVVAHLNSALPATPWIASAGKEYERGLKAYMGCKICSIRAPCNSIAPSPLLHAHFSAKYRTNTRLCRDMRYITDGILHSRQHFLKPITKDHSFWIQTSV